MMGIIESLNQASGAVLAGLLNSLWQAAAVAAAAWLAMRFTSRMNAATRHALWWAVLSAILILPLTPLIVAKRHVAPQPAISQEAPITSSAPFAATAAESAEPGSLPPAPQQFSTSSAPLELRAGAWPIGFAVLWSAVFFLQLGRIAWSYAHLRNVKRTAQRPSPELRRNFDAWMMSCGIHRPARLLVSAEIVSPMAVGFKEPAVILPAPLLEQFQEPELDHVLLHELAHIARKDDWLNLAARLAGAALALHPVAGFVLRQIEREREIACDDWVVSMTGAARPYAASLARLFEVCFVRRRVLLASGMADRASHLGQRIEMLLHRSREFAPNASVTRVGVSAAVLLGFAIAGAQAPRWLAFAQDLPAAWPEDQEAPAAPAAPAVAPTPQAPRAQHAPAAPATPGPAAAPQARPMVDIGGRAYVQVAPRGPISAVAPVAPAAFQAPPPPPASAPHGSFLAALVAAGYGNLPVDDIINLKNAGVSAQFLTGLNQSGWGRVSPQEIIELANHGVSPEYIRKVKDAGVRDVTLKDAIDMAANGVRPENIHEIHALGFGPYTAKQAIQLSQCGVGPELFRALKDYGLVNASLSDIVDGHNTGLNAQSLREAKQYGANLTIKQIIKLKNAGVI